MSRFDEIVDRSKNRAAKYSESELHYGTNDLIPMWIADMDFRTAPEIVDAIIERAKQGIFGYTYRPPEYFEAYREWQERRNGYSPRVENMAFAPGVIPGMRFWLKMCTDEGDGVLICQPVYHPFSDIVLNTGRLLLVSELLQNEDGQYEIDFDDFETKLARAKVFILCNPHNPGGRVWTRKELMKIAELCKKHGVRVFSDEIHSDLILDGTHVVFASLGEDVEAITTSFFSPSKTFNLAGLQAATMVFPTEEEKEHYVRQLKVMDIARNNCFSIESSIAAYECGEPWLEELLDYLRGNMDFIDEFLRKELPMLRFAKPQSTYLAWIDCRALGLTDEKLRDMLVEKGLAVTPGGEFGPAGEGFVRLNAACPRGVIEKALNIMKSVIEVL